MEEAGGVDTLEEAALLITALAGERRAEGVADQGVAAARDAAQAADVALRDAEQEAAGAESESADTATARETAAAAAAAARRALHEARHAAMALSLRSGLESGDRCPVCEQTVEKVPRSDLPDALSGAEAAVAEAEEAESGAQDRFTAAAARLAGARTRVEEARRRALRARERLEEADRQVEAASAAAEASRTRLAAILGDGEAEAELGRRREAVAGADRAVADADALVGRTRRARDRAAASEAAAKDALSGLAAELAAVAARLDAEVEVQGGPEVLERALAVVREAWIDAHQAADAAAAEAEAAVASRIARREELLAGIGLEPGADLRAVLAEASKSVTSLEATIVLLTGRLADLDRLEADERESLTRLAMLERLHGDLAPSKFQAYVLDEYRRDLADLGSEQFEVLTGGRYRFSADGAFDVVDLMAAEQVRSADSLSGGETFLASLALALALAEMVARQGGRLDAFFLDEGFGSLDAEHLDLAMEGVERLVAGADRLVVVVSHVAALEDRIEDLIRLDKDALTGVTRVRSGSEGGR
jgi:exonuclease SbcC